MRQMQNNDQRFMRRKVFEVAVLHESTLDFAQHNKDPLISLSNMATDICTRRLTRELRALQKDPIKSPKVTVQPNEANILEMHYVIEGSEKTPFEGGVYWGKLLFPKTYPLKPPGVIMMTPSGRFQPNRRLCLSMSDFHPGERWQSYPVLL